MKNWQVGGGGAFYTAPPPSPPPIMNRVNYEEPMTKDVGTQTDNTLFELLDHDYSLYHTDYSKNMDYTHMTL